MNLHSSRFYSDNFHHASAMPFNPVAKLSWHVVENIANAVGDGSVPLSATKTVLSMVILAELSTTRSFQQTLFDCSGPLLLSGIRFDHCTDEQEAG